MIERSNKPSVAGRSTSGSNASNRTFASYSDSLRVPGQDYVGYLELLAYMKEEKPKIKLGSSGGSRKGLKIPSLKHLITNTEDSRNFVTINILYI